MAKKQITADWLIPDIVQAYPATRDVLDRYGLKGCGGPAGPRESVAWFANLHGAPLEQLQAELNAAAGQPQPEAVSFRPGLADGTHEPTTGNTGRPIFIVFPRDPRVPRGWFCTNVCWRDLVRLPLHLSFNRDNTGPMSINYAVSGNSVTTASRDFSLLKMRSRVK
jgi:hypothetical protein